MLLHLLAELILVGALEAIDLSSTDEEDERGECADVVRLYDVLALIRIHGGEDDGVGVLLGHLREDGLYHLAGPAPRGADVQHY